ncbi:BQ2448_4708 [Microbotryum intermedium]|uniref:BQ2448_4708 protein n=1 Tax=Microbotryum intermedium TaxID=269621 RepID=A0A238FJF7_9BASI|nr:BQ2448_4708 [Microbotryum intermedium]
MAPTSASKRVIYWFRTDLRLHDSPALAAALALKPEVLYPVWTWDPHYVYSQSVGENRWQFLQVYTSDPSLDSMTDVSDRITSINKKSRLFVVRGPPTTVLPALFKQWKITDIVWEKDDDPYTGSRDAAVKELATQAGVKVHTVLGHTLWDSEELIKVHGTATHFPRTLQGFQKLLTSATTPSKPIDAPKKLPDPGPTDLKDLEKNKKVHDVSDWRKNDVNPESRQGRTTEEERTYETQFAGPRGDFSVPTMEELGMEATTTIHEKVVAMFEKPKTSPAAFEPPATTQLSPHMKFGTLSCRLFWYRVKEIEAKFKAHATPPESLIGQLLWREFYHANQAATPNFNRIRGNNASRYITWSLQTRYDDQGNELPRAEMEKVWKEEEPEAFEHFHAWKEGRTGFPWIDALMRQLRRDGWVHHLGRHSLACFLTRGQLYISWERGAEVFDRYLIDWDPALNSGNWMWLSASAFFSQYFRVYSPATYGQKSDKSGALIRKYCPELDGLSDKYIYEPWNASPAELKRAKVELGKTYPERMVDDKVVKAKALTLIKAAYSAKLQGDDPKVLDGTANAYIELFLPKQAHVKDEETDEKVTIGTKRKAAEGKGSDSKGKSAVTAKKAKTKAGGKGLGKGKNAKQTTLKFEAEEEEEMA